MADQNVYDDPVFFANYKKLRASEGSANACVEQPAMFSLCPPAAGLSVLDLGCGSGETCRAFAEMGAARVVGLDLSENMLADARRQTQAQNVSYVQMSMSDLSPLHDTFDLVVSSLAVHYVADFARFAREVYGLLNPGGVFVFSQEHPLTTAPKDGGRWVRDWRGRIRHWALSDYAEPGMRKTRWFVDGVEKYHRPFSAVINALVSAGFSVEKVAEPMPDADMVRRFPKYAKYRHKPDFLLMRVKK